MALTSSNGAPAPTSGKLVKWAPGRNLVDATNTDAEVADAVTKKHTQNTDTDLDATFEATFVKKADFEAESILVAVADDTPVALEIPASRLFGRKSAGDLGVLTPAEVLALLTAQAAAAFSWNSQNLTNTGTIRAATSVWWHVQHTGGASLNPGASGPTLVGPSADTAGGYQLDLSTEELFFDAHVHDDWDGASDLYAKIIFEVNVDNSGGSAGDTVDLRLQLFYKGNGETACRTQVLEIATVVGQSPRYKQFSALFTIDYDAVSNVVVAGDDVGMILNLETDSSEVGDVIITHVAFEYKTTKVNPEV